MTDDEILVEDYKVVQKRAHAAETAVSYWERTFLLVNGVIFGLFVQILLSDYDFKQFVISFCSVIGIVISIIWFLIQAKGYLYSRIQEYRMEEIEILIRGLKPTLLTFAWFEEVKKYKRDNPIRFWEDVSTYKLRKLFPFLIFLSWLFLGITNLFITF